MANTYQQILEDWKQRCSINQQAHYTLAARFDKSHYLIGLPATILTVVAGATLLTEAVEPGVRTAVGIVGIFAAILTGIQTFYSYARRSESHHATASQLSNIRHRIEILEAFPPTDSDRLKVEIESIRESMAKSDESALTVDLAELQKASQTTSGGGGGGDMRRLLMEEEKGGFG